MITIELLESYILTKRMTGPNGLRKVPVRGCCSAHRGRAREFEKNERRFKRIQEQKG